MYQEYPSSIPLVYKQCPDLLHRTWTRSGQAVPVYCTRSAQAVAPVYKKWPSSCSSVQVVSKLVHMLCTNWALTWAHACVHFQAVSKLGHSIISVTAWTQLVHICEQVSFQVSFQVGHSNFYSSAHRCDNCSASAGVMCIL